MDQHSIPALLEAGLKGHVVVVVGGNGGIGSEVIRQVEEFGAIAINGSRSAAIGPQSHPLDLANPASILRFRDWVQDEWGRIDILVLTAGFSQQLPPDRLDLLTDDLIDAVMTANAIGPLRLLRDFAPLLKAGQDPVVVNVSSIAAKTGGGSNMAYVASKAAGDAITLALAKVLAPDVRVLGVAPSALETGFAKGRKPDFLEKTIAASALKRIATTAEIATSILCAARLLTASTGITIPVDAGRHI